MPKVHLAAAASGLPGVTMITPAMRRQMEEAVERLIAVLDSLDGDTDLEPDNDAEQTGTETLGGGFRNSPFGDDDEDSHDAEAGDADREPTLGWSEGESLTGQLSAGGCRQEEWA